MYGQEVKLPTEYVPQLSALRRIGHRNISLLAEPFRLDGNTYVCMTRAAKESLPGVLGTLAAAALSACLGDA
jgi:hypothetical protein